jgi:hypothetical protein
MIDCSIHRDLFCTKIGIDKNIEAGEYQMDRIQYDVGDIVKMKKQHPCGSDLWEILRTGMDFGIKCKGCGRFVMLPRPKFEKMAKAIVEKNEQTD